MGEKRVEVVVGGEKEGGMEVCVGGGERFLDGRLKWLEIEGMEGLELVDGGDMRGDDVKLRE